MAKGVPGSSIDTRIQKLDESIANLREKIKEKEAQKKALLEEKKASDLAKLQAFISEKNMTAEEAISKLQEISSAE